MVNFGKRSKKVKKNQSKELCGDDLMAAALERIAKIDGKSSNHSSSNTFDTIIPKNKAGKPRLETDTLQKEEKTPSEAPSFSPEESVSSQKEYVDLKVGREILNFERTLIGEISKGKSSIQMWGVGLVIAAIFASAAIMVSMQLFSTQQLKEYISNNFAEKFDQYASKINEKLSSLNEDQQNLKETVDRIKNNIKKKN